MRVLGMTKSGTSAKGEMRLVPKPEGTEGGLKKKPLLVVGTGDWGV